MSAIHMMEPALRGVISPGAVPNSHGFVMHSIVVGGRVFDIAGGPPNM